MSLLHSHYRFVVSLILILAINSWHLHNNLAVHAAKATSLTITNDDSNSNSNNKKNNNNNNKRAKNLADDLLSNDLTPAEKAKAIVDAINPKDIEKIANQINAATKQADTLRQRLQTHVEAQVNKMMLSDNSEAVATVGGDNNNINNNDVVIDAAGTHHKLELKIDLPADLAELVSKGSSLRFSRKENGELGELTISGSAGGDDGNAGGDGSGAASNDDDNGSVSSSSQQQQQQKQQQQQQQDETNKDDDNDPTTPDKLCPYGTFSETGHVSMYTNECEPCPEGTTTLSQGSKSCRLVTEEDLLGMFYDLVNGNQWSEQQKRGWKSKLPACEWEGVSCNENDEINGMAFPIIGIKNTLP